MAPRYRAKRVTIPCVVYECDGELTLEVSGWHIPARGFDPPEYPDIDYVSSTCAHHPGQDTAFYTEVLYDRVLETLADETAYETHHDAEDDH